MGVQDTLSYVLFTNPISSGVGALASVTWNSASKIPQVVGLKPKTEIRMAPPVPLWKLAAATGPYLKLAAVSGASAVILGAYGSHRKYVPGAEEESKKIFETASKYHFFHTLALLGLPMCRSPQLAATFLISGMLIFCGSCYYCAFTGDKRYNFITPYGGVSLIIGWLTMLI